jgi:asparagine synthase (glutamine-hydrolysing)
VGFGDNINELNYARDVAKKYNTEHHEIDLGTPDVAKMLVEMSNVYNEPFADSSHIPTYLISKYARQFVKVVLTGDGADELFGGYSYYKDLISSYDITYNFAKYYFYKILVMATNYSNSNLYNQYHNYYLARISDDMYSRTIGSRTAIDRKERKKLWGKNANRDQEYDFYDSFFTPRADTSGLNRAFYFDLKSYMPGDILVKVDRAAMANSIETRAPFLDRDFAEFALTLPYRLKTSRNDTKMIFKSSFSNYWPESLKTRGKQGFGAPYRHWLTFKDVKDLSLQIFHKDSKLLKLLPGIQPAQASEQSYKTWILLNLGLWLENRDISI